MSMEWRDVPGYEGLYEVSDEGDVRSVRRSGASGGFMSPHNNKGYLRVGLRKNGEAQKKFFVHRLVAEAFLPPVPGKHFVNHKDGDKRNNKPDNLEWCTTSENQKHAYQIGLQKPKMDAIHKAAWTKNKKPIHQLTLDGKHIKTFNSIKEAAESLGMADASHITAVARRRRKQCGGFKWKY